MTDAQIMELITAAKQASEQLRDDRTAWEQLDRITRASRPSPNRQACGRKADRLDAAIQSALGLAADDHTIQQIEAA